MSFFSEMRSALDALSDMVGEDAGATTIPVLVRQLDDDTLVAFIAGATALVRGGSSSPLRLRRPAASAAKIPPRRVTRRGQGGQVTDDRGRGALGSTR